MSKFSCEGLIFDCDGTLADTAPFHYESLRAALEEQGIDLPRDWYFARVGLSRAVLLREFEQAFAASFDPVAIAESLLGTPYLWGGNSCWGIDCSGLVSAAFSGRGVPVPGDSDQQLAELGQALPADAPVQRGDLFFWKGHVGLIEDADTLLHANAHHMAVAHEPIAEAIARIEAQGDGPVTARKRLETKP